MVMHYFENLGKAKANMILADTPELLKAYNIATVEFTELFEPVKKEKSEIKQS